MTTSERRAAKATSYMMIVAGLLIMWIGTDAVSFGDALCVEFVGILAAGVGMTSVGLL